MKMLIFVALFVLVALLAPVNAMTVQELSYGGGDCHAQLANGDTYIGEVDESCITSITGSAVVTVILDNDTENSLELGGTVHVRITQQGSQFNDAGNNSHPTDTNNNNDKPSKQHCDKGGGNGGEGCDPGKHSEKGNDDE